MKRFHKVRNYSFFIIIFYCCMNLFLIYSAQSSIVSLDINNLPKGIFKQPPKYNDKSSDNSKISVSMTISEIDLLKQQLHGCLNFNIDDANIKKIKPVIYIEVNPDRTVKSSKIVNKEKLIDPAFKIAAEVAMRAVNNPNCSPLFLPEDKYNSWKEINFTFDFSWMYD